MREKTKIYGAHDVENSMHLSSKPPIDAGLRRDEKLEMIARRPESGYLSATELFRDLTEEEMQEIDRATIVQVCKAGRILYRPGDLGEMLFILKKGSVQIYRRSAKGRKLVLAQLRPNAIFGEMGFIANRPHDSYAVALEDSVICTIAKQDVDSLIISKPQVALRIMKELSRRAIETERRLEDSVFKGIVQRTASFLIRQAEANHVKGLSHMDIAERLGVYRETVTDALDQLKAAGIINTGRRWITIIDRPQLERMAGEEPEIDEKERSAWVKVVEPSEAEGKLRDTYTEVSTVCGRVDNLFKVHSLHPEVMMAHLSLYQELMFGRSDLTRQERELIGLTVSVVNNCSYYISHHTETLLALTRNEEWLNALKSDPAAAPLDDRRRALIDYVLKLTRAAQTISEDDITVLRRVGFSDSAIHDAATVTAYFNFVNQLALGLGIELEKHYTAGVGG